MALITTSEAKELLPNLTGTAEDTLLTTLIATASRAIAYELGYPETTAGGQPTLETATYTEYLDGPGGRDLILSNWPIQSITSIYDSSDRRYGADELVASTDYTVIDGRHGLVVLDWDSQHGTWSTGRRAIKVTYVAGWATVPDPIKHAAKMLVRHLYGLRTTQGLANQEGSSFREAQLMPKEVKELISKYRLPTCWVPV